MGAIYRFNVDVIKQAYNLINYFETGTGEGTSLSHAMQTKFNRYISVEIYPKIHEKVAPLFPGAEVILGNSVDVMEKILPTLEGDTLFFLDAHFPGADFHFEAYDKPGEDRERLPLEEELKLLKKYRSGNRDIVIIDDLRIYRDGPFHGGNWDVRSRLGKNDDSFIFNILGEMNKTVTVDWRDQGYIIGIPS